MVLMVRRAGFRVPDALVEQAIPVIRQRMENTFALDVPLDVGVGHGKT
jgi:DNA polymerase I-like protein with 3'-5' exonuclease and polymerase domains